jgi:hypothetical protein
VPSFDGVSCAVEVEAPVSAAVFPGGALTIDHAYVTIPVVVVVNE